MIYKVTKNQLDPFSYQCNQYLVFNLFHTDADVFNMFFNSSSQALVAQKFREQKEEERRRRIEELRLRDLERRAQVEDRKRQIWEIERDRREAILRKNQVCDRKISSQDADSLIEGTEFLVSTVCLRRNIS